MPSDEIDMTPEQAIELLKKLDISSPLYYTRKKPRDPFEDMQEGKGKIRVQRRGWRFWARGS